MVFLSTKNLTLPGIQKLQQLFMGTFQVISTGSSIHCLDILPSIAAIYPWFYTSLLKLCGPQPAWLPMLKDDSYEVEAIFQINKRGTNAKVNWLGNIFSQNQCIRLLKLKETACEIVKTFLRG